MYIFKFLLFIYVHTYVCMHAGMYATYIYIVCLVACIAFASFGIFFLFLFLLFSIQLSSVWFTNAGRENIYDFYLLLLLLAFFVGKIFHLKERKKTYARHVKWCYDDDDTKFHKESGKESIACSLNIVLRRSKKKQKKKNNKKCN